MSAVNECNSLDDSVSDRFTNDPDLSPVSMPSNSSSIKSLITSMRPLDRLGREFFDQPCIDLAKSLLGKVLVRKFQPDNSGIPVLLAGRIVETESYPGVEDKASHSYNNRRTQRNAAMYMVAGTSYVYFTYGMYECFNISSREDGAAVLIRAIEPLDGIEYITGFREQFQGSKKRKLDTLNTDSTVTLAKVKKPFKLTELCNGPAKLCIGFNITRQLFNQVDLVARDDLFVADDGYGRVEETDIINASRIGINNAGEWTHKPLRFYVKSSSYVSVKVKE